MLIVQLIISAFIGGSYYFRRGLRKLFGKDKAKDESMKPKDETK
jgi:hypothetical protein